MNITYIVEAVISLLCIAITGVVIPWIKSKTSASTYSAIEKLVTAAVQAAEQIYSGSKRGAEKKAYVKEWLANRNIEVNDEYLDTIIESAVYKLKQSVAD